jgi:hypothetical protein
MIFHPKEALSYEEKISLSLGPVKSLTLRNLAKLLVQYRCSNTSNAPALALEATGESGELDQSESVKSLSLMNYETCHGWSKPSHQYQRNVHCGQWRPNST